MIDSSSKTSARLCLPKPNLGACIFAGIERDTRGAILRDSQRFNYYPATPMSVISWVFSGALHMVKVNENTNTLTLNSPIPRLVLSGPQHQPSASWSPDEVHALSVSFYPEALETLLKPHTQPLSNQIIALEEVASDALLAACHSLFDGNQVEPFKHFQLLLEPIWQGEQLPSAAPYVSAWIRSLTTRAAFSKTGAGLRQMQRRIKSWTEQSYRDLQVFRRMETLMTQVKIPSDDHVLDLVGLANDAGFSDQSHMGREIRKVTGLSPARLANLIKHDEAFWFYRLMDSHFKKENS